MTNICLSIVVPCYNYAYNLERLCDALVLEYGANAEIIFINDGSTDNTAKICAKLEKKYKCFRTENQENQGLSATRRNGQLLAKTEWIYYIDADDLPAEGSGKKIIDLIKGNEPEEDIFIGGYVSVSEKSEEKLRLNR